MSPPDVTVKSVSSPSIFSPLPNVTPTLAGITTFPVAVRFMLFPVIVKSVPSPSIFSASSPKVIPTLAGIFMSPSAPTLILISVPSDSIFSAPKPSRINPTLAGITTFPVAVKFMSTADDKVKSPAEVVKLEAAPASKLIPPALAVNSIAPAPLPCVLVITIVSLVPWLVVNEMALASSVLDDRLSCPPEIVTSFPAAASISIPPAFAVNSIAPAAVPWVFVIVIVSLVPVADWILFVVRLETRKFSYVIIATLPTVLPVSVEHLINANVSSLSSHINPTLFIFVLLPSPRVKIIPKSLFNDVEFSPNFISESEIVLFVDVTVLLTFKSPNIVTDES